MSDEMKIYEFENKDTDAKVWVAAYNLTQAFEEYDQVEGSDEPFWLKVLPRPEWEKISVTNPEYDETDPESWETMTFEQFMETVDVPIVIAGTEFG